ncbi:MAG: amidophosphoribosyltransferase [Lachnospiraceae bacterium]|jgi:amidophosphoribosyltransferase|nr:amidophosphoribosyltransferase [Lachnospiraceae bacterium]
MRKINEECGVFGAYQVEDAASAVYFGLHSLQHRGQEGAGIAVSDGKAIALHKGAGLVTEVMDAAHLRQLGGVHGIGHVRYATEGGAEPENIQPLIARAQIGSLAVCHNGQIVNAAKLRLEQEEKGHIFHGTSDSEIILHLIQGQKGPLMEKIKKACRQLEGAFAFLILTDRSLYAIRDRHGLRPLSIGYYGDGYLISSETCGFDAVGGVFWRDVEPGEVVKFSQKGIEFCYYTEEIEQRLCSMEHIYFARPDSNLDGLNVHTMRKRTGRLLAQKDEGTLEADMVVAVPDSAMSAASGYSETSGLPLEMGLIKNRYVGRTFIEPTQQQREMGVRMKLSVNRRVVEGKRVVLIDDSLVRSTTARRIIAQLRSAGVKEVHLRIAAPEYRYPCFYGVDTATREELISAQMDPEELCAYLKADSLKFLTVEDLKKAYGSDRFCFSCFTGEYVTALYK